MIKRIGFALLTLFLIGLTTAAICCCALAYYINTIVKPEAELDINSLSMKFNSVIYYENSKGKNKVLQTLKSDENREWVSKENIPDELKQAFVAIEDKRFYEHNGVDWKRTAGAALNWILPSGSGYGGSTITQQLIKNMTDDDDYSVKRKITEIVRALTLEEQVDKDTILELYMNIIYFGENSYGVQTASQTYFGKSVSKLDLAECAMIAGLTQNPSKYDPYKNPEEAKERQKTVLIEMYEQGYISKKEYDEALAEELEYKRGKTKAKEGGVYSYFTDMVVRDVIHDLMEQKGYSEDYATAMVKGGGLSIYSTIDLDVQSVLDSVYENSDYFPYVTDSDGTPLQSAMIVLDPKNGNILGVVGGRGEKTESLALNRATQSPRSPGSSIKPISTYAPALDAKLITPYSTVTDMPVFEYNDSPWPKNENWRYTGQTTIMDGVAKSTNTVAVQVMKKLTPDSAFDFLTEKLGVTTLSEEHDRDYAPMALGGLTNGMTVREMAQAYTALANYGKYSEAKSYTKVVDANGNTLLSHEDDEAEQVFERKSATPYYMNDLLTNAVENGTGQLAQMYGYDVAGKTGTTTDNRDRWFAGYTPYYVGVCWVGFDSAEALPDLSPNPAVSAWSSVMNKLHEGKEYKSFKQPKRFVEAEYCMDSGSVPTDICQSDRRGGRVQTGYFFEKDVPKEECTMHAWYNGLSLLDLTRLFPISVEVEDEYYCFRGSNKPIGKGEQVYSSNGHYYAWYAEQLRRAEEARKAAEAAAAAEKEKDGKKDDKTDDSESDSGDSDSDG
ncbi:MAG: transglycosylase domain-containing protein [Butyricicoccus sp.]